MKNQIDISSLDTLILGESTPEPLLYAFQRKSSAHAGGENTPISSDLYEEKAKEVLSNTEGLAATRCLYIHIPFCLKKCNYCDFLSFSNISNQKIQEYVKYLCEEIKIYSEYSYDTIYFGGEIGRAHV